LKKAIKNKSDKLSVEKTNTKTLTSNKKKKKKKVAGGVKTKKLKKKAKSKKNTPSKNASSLSKSSDSKFAGLSEGEIFQCMEPQEQFWRLGKTIGKGGFGMIYICSKGKKKPSEEELKYVMKIEPYEQRSLLDEINFYIGETKTNITDEDDSEIVAKPVGMPTLRGSGTHTINGEKYRFLVGGSGNSDLVQAWTCTLVDQSRQ